MIHISPVIHLLTLGVNALKGIINCENLFISLTLETLVLAWISLTSAHFTECSECKATFPSKRSVPDICQLSFKLQPSGSFLYSVSEFSCSLFCKCADSNNNKKKRKQTNKQKKN